MLIVEKAIGLVTSLLITPFLVYTLGTEDYGLWILILSVLGWFNVLDLGFPAAVQRYITLALEKGDKAKVNSVFSTSLVLFSSIGVIAVAGIILLANFPGVLGTDSIDHPTVSFALCVLSLKVLWDFVMMSFHGFFAGLLRFDIDANISSLNSITKALLVFALVPSLHIGGVVFATLMADTLSNLLKLYYCKKLYQPLRFRIAYVTYDELARLFHFSKHVAAIGVARTLNTKSAPFIIAKVLDLGAVAIFSIADRLVNHAQSFAYSVAETFGPVFTRKVARHENMASLFLNVSSINIFSAAVVFFPLIVFGSTFIELWVGLEFALAYWISVVLVIVFFCRFVSHSVRQVLLAQGNHQLISVIQLIGASLNIFFSIMLAAKYGLIGMAIGSAIGAITADLVLSLILLRKYNDFAVTPVLRTLFSALVVTVGLGLALNNVLSNANLETWYSFVLIAAPAFPIMVGLLFVAILPNNLRKIILGAIANRIRTMRYR